MSPGVWGVGPQCFRAGDNISSGHRWALGYMHAFSVKLVIFFFVVRSCNFFLRETRVKKNRQVVYSFFAVKVCKKNVTLCNFFLRRTHAKKCEAV